MSADSTDRTDAARAYYRAIDAEDYESLAALLARDFRQERPDRTLRGRERFVTFVAEERPATDTTHAVDAVYSDDREVAVRGRLRRDGDTLFRFVDVFSFEDGRVVELRTYTR